MTEATIHLSEEEEPHCERWEPGGAVSDDEEAPRPPHVHSTCPRVKFERKLKSLEEDQELLNSSLCALTTHFAQVQFRLRQAVAASHADKEILLKSLEEFAFRGVPDVGLVRKRMEEASLAETVWIRRVQQQEFIEKLKMQIDKLEKALSFGEEETLRQNELENQRVVMGELKLRLKLSWDGPKYRQLTREDVKEQVDLIQEQLMGPIKIKDSLVEQLKAQIDDLERFISYVLTDEEKRRPKTVVKQDKSKRTRGIVKRITAVIYMFGRVYLGCTNSTIGKNSCNYWGDLRANLEMAIARLLEALEEEDSASLVTLVRKDLGTCLRDLIQHGIRGEAQTPWLVPFSGCFRKLSTVEAPTHAWQIILVYYQLENGEKIISDPNTKLSQSFNLNIGDSSSAKSDKQNLLVTIANIQSAHALFKRNDDCCFRGFICAALNAGKLVEWLGMIFRCRRLLELHYCSWSYAVSTRFSDSLQSLARLSEFEFNLPVDLAIRRFQNIKDAFN